MLLCERPIDLWPFSPSILPRALSTVPPKGCPTPAPPDARPVSMLARRGAAAASAMARRPLPGLRSPTVASFGRSAGEQFSPGSTGCYQSLPSRSQMGSREFWCLVCMYEDRVACNSRVGKLSNGPSSRTLGRRVPRCLPWRGIRGLHTAPLAAPAPRLHTKQGIVGTAFCVRCCGFCLCLSDHAFLSRRNRRCTLSEVLSGFGPTPHDVHCRGQAGGGKILSSRQPL